MNILFLLIPLSIVLLSLAIWAFFWAVKNDQFEDMEGPAYSILFDEDEKKPDSEPAADSDKQTETEQAKDKTADQSPQ
ncbi:MAG: cbb3-type cytochrome oxidase assembly protein CcoS [Marinospirillum sp.]|uniref:cbb3-type cytochrome oxidase assembly protein CcoS n=1 Tax=Marinospirillum sp. TaxID=2183934 RepID=UPI0019EA08F7|nr:cbb3-type cytochrome oxidase assembly protein CcoS [Marinospirillum sp.]MBE0506438.1 cbb3-type cytochrome oxidase assembly protein CcoS [Marinospirillum sp.]